MRVLVITHGNNSIYGAATSLKMLLQNCNWEYDLVYSRFIKHRTPKEDMRKYTGNTVNQLWDFFLPYAEWAVVKEFRPYKLLRSLLLKPLIFIDGFRLKKIIKEGNYDYILLNSLVLFPLIDKHHQYVLYVREANITKGVLQKIIVQRLNKAHKLIIIDPALIPTLPGIKSRFQVINNPFDMTEMSCYNLEDAQNRYPEIDCNKVVVMIAGILSPVKGVDFVIDAFNCIKRNDLQLVIVGKGINQRYIDYCKKIADHNEKILFLGEQKDMKPLYMVTDYLIRAEEMFLTGRTVYEALYSGCNVLLQYKEKSDVNYMQEYKRFEDRIVLYKAREKDDLCQKLELLPSEKVKDREFLSNIRDYCNKVTGFITE